MKKIISIIGLLSINLLANTTMCYKNNHNNPATIEQQIFDGGECQGQNSIDDMKANGWEISDIKLSNGDNGFNYIYILKKSSNSKVSNQKIDYQKLSKNLKQTQDKIQYEKDIIDGKRYYTKNCQQCHGLKGELKSMGTSRPLNTLSFDEMVDSIRGYEYNEYDRGMAIIMIPYANLIIQNDLKKISIYLQSINKR